MTDTTAPRVDPAVSGVLLVGFRGTSAPDWVRRWVADGLAGVCLFGRNCASPEQVARLVAQLRAERADVLVAIDEEGGQVTRLENAGGSTLPGNALLGHLDEPETTRMAAAEAARRLREVDVDVNLAPVADVNVNPENPVIGVRSFGSDPGLVARHVAAYVAGLQQAGVAACAKHFPGHGDTTVDSHVGLPVVSHDRDTWERVDLPPFRAAMAAGVQSIMTAHLRLPAIADAPATVSPEVLTGLLRDDLGFRGVCITDALEMAGIAATVGVADGAVAALGAGADLICSGLREEPGLTAARGLEDALRSGRLGRQRLRAAADRVAGLAAWCRGRRHDGVDAGCLDLLPAVRRAAVQHDPHGRLPLAVPIVVAEVSARVGPGVGTSGARLEEMLPAASRVDVHGDPDAVPAALERARGRSLVATVRDLGVSRGTRDALARLLGERPDTVVVATGRAADTALLPEDVTHVAVHASGRAHLQVAAELLTR